MGLVGRVASHACACLWWVTIGSAAVGCAESAATDDPLLGLAPRVDGGVPQIGPLGRDASTPSTVDDDPPSSSAPPPVSVTPPDEPLDAGALPELDADLPPVELPGDAGGSTVVPDPAFDSCLTTLTPQCSPTATERGCASQMTPVIPLSDGTRWGNIEVELGDYGAYVEWNEGAAFSTVPSPLEDTCTETAAGFGEPAVSTRDALNLHGADLGLYTIYRPACMRAGERYPVITWGNGTCGKTAAYGTLLSAVASHGYVVIASNSRWVDQGSNEVLRALSLAEALDNDPSHVLYKHIDLTRVGAMGHSRGATAVAMVASDPRIDAVLLWNGPVTADKPFLSVSGERDREPNTPESMAAAISAAAQPGAWLYYREVLQTGGTSTGNLVLMQQPERVAGVAVNWWNYRLKGDRAGRTWFTGAQCALCGDKSAYSFGSQGLD
jgi:Chlorophyllase enzyme